VVLQGITGSNSDRKALLNDCALGVGDTASLEIQGRIVVVRCLEIRDQSVVLSIPGQTEPLEVFQAARPF
jgi:hypothetical protein